MLRKLLAVLGLVTVALVLPSTLQVWMDEGGHTYLTNTAGAPGADAVRLGPEEALEAWRGKAAGAKLRGSSAGVTPDDRYLRELRGAADDLRRGETRRGLGRLRHLHRAHPGRPEAPWLIAQVERRRGRLTSAREALDDLLSLASAVEDRWREAAHALRDEIDSELELERTDPAAATSTETLDTPHFRVSYDHAFAGREYGSRVERLLENARSRVDTSLGRVLEDPLEVHLYTRGRYLDSYQHKFGFATVGFYDGAIHVVSARHPRDELLALLVHEYAHAVFRDTLGSDRPFFLNEGIADREEERVRGREQLAREEWRQLLEAIRSEQWIPLASIVSGFGGLKGRRALLAYLESRASVELIEQRHPRAVERWLNRCAAGQEWEAALKAETGWNLPRLEDTLRGEVLDRFPEDPLIGTLRGS